MVSSPATDHQTEALPPPTAASQPESKLEPESQQTQDKQGPEQKQHSNLNNTTRTTDRVNNNGHQKDETANAEAKWPGWPGHNVYRLIVPVLKVGSIIGRKGELVKKLCEETRARVRVLEGNVSTTDRIVLISGKEEPDAQLSPAMDAVIRVFKRVSGLTPSEVGSMDVATALAASCSIRLLVASPQAIHLIGRQGLTIKSIQENSGASVRVLSEDELPSYATSDERIVDIHGETMKVLKALEAVLGQLRKFLVDHSVLTIFEKNHNATIQSDREAQSFFDKTLSFDLKSATPVSSHAHSVVGSDFSLSMKREPFVLDREVQADSNIPYRQSLYGSDSGLGGLHSTVSGRKVAPIITQMTKIMQIPLSYAEDIIGVGGANIAYIRRTSGAILTVQESGGLPDEITIEIKGTSSQVEAAEQLIQDFINNHREPVQGLYGSRTESRGLSSFSHLADTTYPSSLGSYGSSSLGGYNYRY